MIETPGIQCEPLLVDSSDSHPAKHPFKKGGDQQSQIPIPVKARGDTQLQTMDEMPSQLGPGVTGPPAAHASSLLPFTATTDQEEGSWKQRCSACGTSLPSDLIYCTGCGESLATDPLVGKTFEQRYEVMRRLGAGAMGAVYEVRHLRLNKRFAMKVIHRELTQIPEFLARFEREALSMSHLQHANCVTVTDFGRAATGEVFLVMEYLKGQPLSELLDAPIPLGTALEITRQILQGLKHAHSVGIIHRDIKPENVMCVQDADHHWQVKVVDFGIAKIPMSGSENERITQAGIIFGTPEYMAPEQALSTDVNKEADLYAVGVILWHMLTGRLLFEGAGQVEILGTKLSQAAPSLDQAAPGVFSPRLMNLLRRTLERDPLKRIPSAEEMLREIHAIRQQPGAGLAVSRIPAPLRRCIVRTRSLLRPAAQLYGSWYHCDGLLGPPGWKTRLRGLVTTVRGWTILLLTLGALALLAAPLLLWMPPWDDGVPLSLPVLAPKGAKGGADAPPSTAQPKTLPPMLARAKKLLAKKACRDASLTLKNYVQQHPKQSMGHYLLGAAQICRKYYSQGLAAYTEAIRHHHGYHKDARIIEDATRLLRVTKVRYKALEFLITQVGEPALPTLLKVASHSARPRLRKRAQEALADMGQADQIDRIAALTWEIRQGKTCRDRGSAVAKIGQLEDPQALPILRELRDERTGFLKRKYRFWCIRKVLIKTIKKLEAL